VYYQSVKAAPKLQERFVVPIKRMIEEEPSFGYRAVANLLGFNKNTVQRVFRRKGWQVRKRPIGHRPRIEALPSVATAPDERWATDLCRVWGGSDGGLTLALVMDCHTRELLGWQLSRSGKASTATAAFEQALIARFGTLGQVNKPFLLRSDNGLVFSSRSTCFSGLTCADSAGSLPPATIQPQLAVHPIHPLVIPVKATPPDQQEQLVETTLRIAAPGRACGLPRLVSNRRWAAAATATTTRWPRPSTASTRPS
jgi:hypothetical protein